jgi:cellulose synthase/poly-beta-1,6-N-acetylglucosamine synthase-like glycosyltransferase
MKKNVSVIVPTHNEEENISNCLNSLFLQTTKPTEIIVVNDNSTDGTQKILTKLSKAHKNLKVVNRSKSEGYTQAVLSGINKAKGDIVAILDADSSAPKGWLKKIVEAYDNGKVGCVGGPYLPSNSDKPFPRIEYAYLWNMYNTGRIKTLPGTNLTYDRKKAEKINLFKNPPHFAIDKHIQTKLKSSGYTIKLLKDNPIFSKTPESFCGYLKPRFRWGKGMTNIQKTSPRAFVLKLAISVLPILPILALIFYTTLTAILSLMSLLLSSLVLSIYWEKLNLLQSIQLILVKGLGHYVHALGYIHQFFKRS